LAEVHLAGCANRTMSGIPETSPGCLLPDYEKRRIRFGSGGCRFSTKVEKGEK